MLFASRPIIRMRQNQRVSSIGVLAVMDGQNQKELYTVQVTQQAASNETYSSGTRDEQARIMVVSSRLHFHRD